LTSITAAGRQTFFSYDAAGNVTEVRDEAGTPLVRNNYDARGQLIASTPAAGPTTHFAYDANGNRTASWHVRQAFQPDGTAYDVQTRSETDYDPNGRVTATRQVVIDRPGTPQESARTLWTTATHYNAVGQVDWTLDRFGNRTETIYDKRRQPIQTRTLTRSASEWDPVTRSVSEGDAWLLTRTVYDAAGRAILTANSFVEDPAVTAANQAAFNAATGTYTSFTFDDTTPTTATYSIYDATGRVVETQRLKDVVIKVSGTAPNLQTQIAVAGDDYDPLTDGELKDFFLAKEIVVSSSQTQYGPLGRVAATFDQYGNETRTTYNTYGDVIQTATQARSASEEVWLVTRTVYDGHGRVEFTLDRLVAPDPIPAELTGFGTHTVYDAQGRAWKTERVQNLTITLANDDSTAPSRGQFISDTRTIYNSKGQVESSVAADDQVTKYEYDSLGRQVATIGHAVPAGSVSLPHALKSQIPDLQSTFVRHRSETVYDAEGRVAAQRANLVQVEDAAGNVIAIDGSAVQETSYEYDAFGNRVRTTFTDGSFILVRYDDFGRQVAEAQQVPAGTNVQWSEQAQSFVVPPSGGSPEAVVPTKLFEYDAQGRLSAVILPAVQHPDTGQMVRPRYEYGYDARGNQTLIRDPLLRETWFTFDAQGRQLTRTLPLGFGPDGIAGTSDDATVSTDAFTERFEYNDFGQQTLHVSFEGVVTALQYDTDDGVDVGDAGRLIAKRYFESLAGYQTWRADQEDGAPFTVNPDELWTYTYDAFGRQTHVAVALRDTMPGELTPHRFETTTYDAQGRIVTIATPEGTIHYQYDPATGRRTRSEATAQVGDPAALVTVTVTDTHYLYDALGRLDAVAVHWRNGERVDVDPDTPGFQPEVTDYVYDLLGNLDQVRGLNGVIADYDYDALNRLELLRHFRDENANGTYEATIDTLLAQYDYDLLADGRRAGVTEKIWQDADENGIVAPSEIAETRIDWFYDDVGRLTREIYDGPGTDLDYATDYIFDLVGNRLEKLTDATPNEEILVEGETLTQLAAYRTGAELVPDRAITYSYDANDRLLTELVESIAADGTRAAQQTTLYEYGPNADPGTGIGGDWTMQTRKTVWQGADTGPETGTRLSDTQYDYNLQNRMSGAVIDSDGDGPVAPTTVEYEYDATGIRISKVEGTDKVLYLVDRHNPTGYAQVLAEIAVAEQIQQLIRSYTLGLDVISQAEAAGPVYHLLYDGHGSTRALLNGAGCVIAGQAFAYDAYGNAIGFYPTDALTTLLYSGEQFDQRLQMQYLRARYYDLATGRFNRVDPFFGNLNDPLSLHKYLYVHGDPIRGTDPSGKFLGSIISVIGAFAGMMYARRSHDTVVTSAGFSAGALLRNLVGYAAYGIGGNLLGAGTYFGFIGLIPTRGNSQAATASAIANHLDKLLEARLTQGSITSNEFTSGRVASEAIATAYVTAVNRNRKSHGGWLGNTTSLGNKCTEWVKLLSEESGIQNALKGTKWSLRIHYNVPKFGWWESYAFLPHFESETGGLEMFVPIHPLHSFMTLTFKDDKDPETGKSPFPDVVLDPWSTNSPEIYDPHQFHETWPLNHFYPGIEAS